jgi:hypothetical protein
MKLLRKPTLNNDHFQVERFEAVNRPTFRLMQEAEYARYESSANAVNKLKRGLRWGILMNGAYSWNDRNKYRLDAHVNPEEMGNTRLFGLVCEEFLRTQEIENTLDGVFEKFGFVESSYERAYEVQLSAIRYEATLAETALPAPLIPHQDAIDGAILMLNKTNNILGGVSRLYSLDDEPLVEIDLAPGEVLFIRDAAIKHQVTPLMMSVDDNWRPGDKAFRDVLLIRFQPLGR